MTALAVGYQLSAISYQQSAISQKEIYELGVMDINHGSTLQKYFPDI